MVTNLNYEFNAIASAAHDASPKALHNLVVLLCPSEETPVYVSPEIADHLSKNTAAVKEALIERQQYMLRARFGALACPNYPLADKTVTMIALQEKNLPTSTQSIFTLNHEIGHLVVEHGTPPPQCTDPIIRHHAECAADIYASLLHIQKFGKETLYQAHRGGGAAIVLGTSPIHYTDAVIERATRNIETADLTNHSLQDIAELAGDLATEHHLNLSTLAKICAAFSPVAQQYQKTGGLNHQILNLCLEIIQNNKNDPDILRAGQAFFRLPMNNSFLKACAKIDPWYQDALDLLAPEEKQPVARTAVPKSTPAIR